MQNILPHKMYYLDHSFLLTNFKLFQQHLQRCHHIFKRECVLMIQIWIYLTPSVTSQANELNKMVNNSTGM